jgi:hypothetical protein
MTCDGKNKEIEFDNVERGDPNSATLWLKNGVFAWDVYQSVYRATCGKCDFTGACSLCNRRALYRPTKGPSLTFRCRDASRIVLCLPYFSKVGHRIERQHRQNDAIDRLPSRGYFPERSWPK